MGLAASTSRYLMLFARKSDIEFRGQQINQARLGLATQSERIAKLFSDKMSNRNLQVRVDGSDQAMSGANLSLVNLKALYAANNGEVPTGITPAALEEGLRNGSIYLQYINNPESPEPPTGVVDWRSNTALHDRLYTEDDEAAAAMYEAESAALHSKDKKLEVELKNIEIQHSAVQTEIDAVKKVIDKNIEKSFKTFG